MGWILLLGAGVVVGLVIARWWLLPVPVVAYFILDAVSPVARDDDVTGFGRAVVFTGFLLALGVGIGAGKLIRRIDRTHDRRESDEKISN
jgi:hypothetical protein